MDLAPMVAVLFFCVQARGEVEEIRQCYINELLVFDGRATQCTHQRDAANPDQNGQQTMHVYQFTPASHGLGAAGQTKLLPHSHFTRRGRGTPRRDGRDIHHHFDPPPPTPNAKPPPGTQTLEERGRARGADESDGVIHSHIIQKKP